MKELYTKPEAAVEDFEAVDILTTSPGDPVTPTPPGGGIDNDYDGDEGI